MILSSMKKTEAIKHQCEFCEQEFVRESSFLKHICKYKHRWIEKDKQGNRIGFQAWLQFYSKTSMSSSKNRTYIEFVKSPYYTAFVKFGTHCAEINAINISMFVEWLLKHQIKIDTWCKDTVYDKYLIEHLRTEDPYDAITRSIEYTIVKAEEEGIQSKDYLRYGNKNKISYAITTGKISPWMLFQSNSGVGFLDTLNPEHISMIISYINPELWTIKFKRDPEIAKQIKELLNAGGY